MASAEWVCTSTWYTLYNVDLMGRFDAGSVQVRNINDCMRETNDNGYDAAVYRSDLGRCYFKDTRGYGSQESFHLDRTYVGPFHVPGYDRVWKPSLTAMQQWLIMTNDPCHIMTRVNGQVTCKLFDPCPSGSCALILKNGENCRDVCRGRGCGPGGVERGDAGRNATEAVVPVKTKVGRRD
ncbi:hypothetical protein BCR44DRAFT_33916 [Catenaria anguillulae PL171]|uniref:Uncharacterized protein n=1 Tax=Catenaria anguillulae PL171 TaxID=765915 RepID=A0A1Y2HQ38_9FUNG|nr:hypothetical protein BCR44DRAFT_33916 [Catenaria anguillulae PL171]